MFCALSITSTEEYGNNIIQLLLWIKTFIPGKIPYIKIAPVLKSDSMQLLCFKKNLMVTFCIHFNRSKTNVIPELKQYMQFLFVIWKKLNGKKPISF